MLLADFSIGTLAVITVLIGSVCLAGYRLSLEASRRAARHYHATARYWETVHNADAISCRPGDRCTCPIFGAAEDELEFLRR